MKTTLIIPDQIFRELKRIAARQRATLSAVVEETLRRGLSAPDASDVKLPPLPSHRMGTPRVDVADRDALYRAMDGK
jgi:hypothetical protein